MRSTTSRRSLAACLILTVAVVAACEKPIAGLRSAVTLDLWQAPGFYFLPPVVTSQPSFSGTFDADITTLNPAIAICDVTNGPDVNCGSSSAGATPTVAVFTTTSTPAITLDLTTPQYQVNWATQGPLIIPGHVYRVHVTAGAVGTRREVGYADILFRTQRTLPIQFRIETAISGNIVVSAATSSITTGGTDQLTATVQDLHGSPVSGATVTWTVTTNPTTGVVDPTQPLNPTSGVTGTPGTTTSMLTAGGTAGTATVSGATAGLTASVVVTVKVVVAKPFYVANTGNTGQPSITAYADGANGNVAPTLTIAGTNTLLTSPYGVTHDAAGNLYVADLGSSSVMIYAAGASGNVAPTATITGANTGLSAPVGIALDAAGNIYVANDAANTITVYAAGTSGNVLPMTTISGENTGLNSPAGIALDGTGKLYVANLGGSTVTVYAAGATGNATPTATITGASTGLNMPFGITVAGSQLYVANQTGNSVVVYPASATGNVAPSATITGPTTTLSEPAGIAVDAAGQIYVANFNLVTSGGITVYAAGASGDAAPTATISGASTGLVNPALISF